MDIAAATAQAANDAHRWLTQTESNVRYTRTGLAPLVGVVSHPSAVRQWVKT